MDDKKIETKWSAIFAKNLSALKEENGYSYQIATKEKALCDKLYTLKPLKNYDNLENMLLNDLRIDYEKFKELDAKVIEAMSELYHSTNVNLLAKYLRRKD